MKLKLKYSNYLRESASSAGINSDFNNDIDSRNNFSGYNRLHSSHESTNSTIAGVACDESKAAPRSDSGEEGGIVTVLGHHHHHHHHHHYSKKGATNHLKDLPVKESRQPSPPALASATSTPPLHSPPPLHPLAAMEQQPQAQGAISPSGGLDEVLLLARSDGDSRLSAGKEDQAQGGGSSTGPASGCPSATLSEQSSPAASISDKVDVDLAAIISADQRTRKPQCARCRNHNVQSDLKGRRVLPRLITLAS